MVKLVPGRRAQVRGRRIVERLRGRASVRMTTDEIMALPPDSFARLHLLMEAAFLAGKAFLRYHRRKGFRTAPLPDFLIGAHAAVAGRRLLTRDDRRYRTYFPSLALVAPNAR